MQHVLLVGAFGQGNPGDEALCDAFCAALRGTHVTVATTDPTTALRHGAAAIPPSPAAVARAVREVDLLVVGGGTVFKPLHRSTGRNRNGLLRSTAALVGLARACGVPVAMVGVGASDLTGSEAKHLARWIVRHVDLLVLRDEESAAVLAAAGVPAPFRTGGDPAWTLFHPPEPHPVTRRDAGWRPDTITVALSHLAGDDRLTGNLGAALASLEGRFHIRLQPWQAADDRSAARPSGAGQTAQQQRDVALARDLAARLGDGVEILDPPTDLDAARDSLRGDRLVVAMRFHALVAAAAAGTPALAIAHEPKLGGLARRLDQPAVPPHAGAAVMERVLAEALSHPPPAAAAIAGEITRAEEGMALMRLLLARGAHDEPTQVRGLSLSSGAGSW